MNVVLDTNIIISGLIYEGKPGFIVDLVTTGKIKAITSPILIDELCRILERKFNYDAAKLQRIRRFMDNTFAIVQPTHIPDVIKEDPADNQLLAVTHEGSIKYIVSGDKHLLRLRKYNKTLIIKPNEFLTILKENTETSRENLF